jgi:propionate CoA-transferase
MRVVTAQQAVQLLHDGDTFVIGGSHAIPEDLIAALAARFQEEGAPRDLTYVGPELPGDGKDGGVSRLAHPGLLRRVVSGVFVDAPAIADLVSRDAVQGYSLPQGVLSQLMREMAAGRPGLITHVGLHTFVDPRLGGGRQSPSAMDDLVEVVKLGGREWLRYLPFNIDLALLRGTTADGDGNISMEREANYGEGLAMAQATHRNGGVVVVQVSRLAQAGTLPPKSVKIPGILVDLVVLAPNQKQTYLTEYNPAYSGELRIPISDIPPMPLSLRKDIARRAAMELFPEAVCNLGVGVSTGVAAVAAEEGILDLITLTNEQGLIGGAPAGGVEAGAAINFAAMLDQPAQFDFYDGGGLDLAFLSFAEAQADGSVNVSRFGGRVNGIGGFVNISQNAKRVIFSGQFTSGGLRAEFDDGRMAIVDEGKVLKFVTAVEQLSYSGPHGREREQDALYITERAVFRGSDPIELIEVAPGLDVERDVLRAMEFKPSISADLREMDARIFHDSPIGLSAELATKPPRGSASRLRELKAGKSRHSG